MKGLVCVCVCVDRSVCKIAASLTFKNAMAIIVERETKTCRHKNSSTSRTSRDPKNQENQQKSHVRIEPIF
jgi:hypothetical protein